MKRVLPLSVPKVANSSLLTVTEPELYRLIFKSHKPVAKRFQRWVFHEVLPSLRRTGSYTIPKILEYGHKTYQSKRLPRIKIMKSIDPAVNNPKLQPEVIVLDEFAAIEKSLEGHPQRQEILKKLQKYQSQLLWQEQNKKG